MSQTHVHLLYFVGIIEGITGQAILLTDVSTQDGTQKTGKWDHAEVHCTLSRGVVHKELQDKSDQPPT